MRLTVMGAGYVGLVTAACLARLGHQVGCVEVAPERLAALRAGRVPFHEPGLADIVAEGIAARRLQPVGDASGPLPGTEAVLVCVGTPLGADGTADLSQVRSACEAIRKHAPDAVVVVRSTLPTGAWSELGRWLGRASMARVVLVPEFLRQGSAVADFLAPTRIVIGTHDGRDGAAAQAVRRMVGPLDAPVVVTDFASAEMIKNAANVFLATKLAFINEVADLCASSGANVDDVVRGIGLDPRIGSSYLRAGIGFGGSCLPKELANLVRLGRAAGVDLPMLAGALEDNATRPRVLVDRLEARLGRLGDRRVALLGLAFKPHTDDLRDSPAVALAHALLARGATVTAHDPIVQIAATDGVPGLRRARSAVDACRGADLVVLATEWPEYEGLDWARLARLVRRRVLFDGRRTVDAGELRQAGWLVLTVGRAEGWAIDGQPVPDPPLVTLPLHQEGHQPVHHVGSAVPAHISHAGLAAGRALRR